MIVRMKRDQAVVVPALIEKIQQINNDLMMVFTIHFFKSSVSKWKSRIVWNETSFLKLFEQKPSDNDVPVLFQLQILLKDPEPTLNVRNQTFPQ